MRKKAEVKAAPASRSSAPPVEELASTPDTGAPIANFPVVGIGASAGGLAAFEAFFSGMPEDADPGMAFVLVQHLAPDHKSILTELIRRYTRMQVFEVEDGMGVRPNCAYIIPPNRDMAFLNGALHLMEPSAPRGQRLPVDFFFRSLAQDQRERAICIVLSGTGSDGTNGLRAVKGEGGLVLAQEPGTTEYEGMPRSAIATGLVDYILPPAKMAAQLIAYANHAFGRAPQTLSESPAHTDNALKKVFILLRAQTGHDFSQYKLSTLRRRVERRMAIHQIDAIGEYIKYLNGAPSEVDALFRDFLIGVTCFFRDPAAFKALEEEVIPKLFAEKATGTSIRVWSPGCSTGEEAYSLAMLLKERADVLDRSHRIQVFATDIDAQAIATARAGLYPANIAADVPPQRLARFFEKAEDGNSYRIHKDIREILVFSEQDVIKDPPFSRLDLISCRNLLIYMGGDLQKKLIPLFHYALNPEGFLFLGSAETVGDFTDLFSTVDRKFKLYRRKEQMQGASRAIASRFPPLSTIQDVAAPPAARKTGKTSKPPLRELTEQSLLQHAAQVGALVNGQGDILYLHGRAGHYLEPASGEGGVSNILNMAREGLLHELTVALRKAAGTREVVRHPGLRIKNNGTSFVADLTIRPVAPDSSAQPDELFYLVILEPGDAGQAKRAEPDEAESCAPLHPDFDARVIALKQELRAKEEYLQTTNEELRSSNEEMQSINEELQSTNEELETSKEELQSVNEELSTVNAELQSKVTELSRVNNDMNNLLAGTDIATVFVDFQLRILRFTPAATRLINLILSDVGRPVGHLVSNLAGYDRLLEDVQGVLDTLIPKEIEVQTKAGEWYQMRIHPYRTLDNVIEGAVITFINTTRTRKAQEELLARETKLKGLFEILPVGVSVLDKEGKIVYLNPALGKILKMSRDDLMQEEYKKFSFLKPDGTVLSPEEFASKRALREQREVLNVNTGIRKEDGEIIWVSVSAVPSSLPAWGVVIVTAPAGCLGNSPKGSES